MVSEGSTSRVLVLPVSLDKNMHLEELSGERPSSEIGGFAAAAGRGATFEWQT